MKNLISKALALSVITLVSMQSFASNGPLGTYRIDGPTDEPGDENTITFESNGDVTLVQNTVGRLIYCNGKYQVQGGVLRASGECSYARPFKLVMDLTDVKDFSYFRATVFANAIYPKAVEMRFERHD